MIKDIRKTAELYKKRFSLTAISEKALCDALCKQGYTVIYFNSIYNEGNVSQIIDSLNLEKYIQLNKGFTYASDKYRLVFINEDLSEEERILVLAHEQGHIICEHTACQPIIGQDVKQEHEANEFAHFLLYPSRGSKIRQKMKKHRKLLLAMIIVAIVIGAGISAFSMVSNKKSFYGKYYITETGNRYHKENCVFVKNKNNVRRLTEKEFESGEYEPCQTCLP